MEALSNYFFGGLLAFFGVIIAIFGQDAANHKIPKIKRLQEIYYVLFGCIFILGGLYTMNAAWPSYLIASSPFVSMIFKKFTVDLIKDKARKKYAYLDHISDGMMLTSLALTTYFFYDYPGDWALILVILLFSGSLALDTLHYKLN